MSRALSLLIVGACAYVLVGLPTFAQAPPDITLTRIDCGMVRPTDAERFTDTFAYKDLKVTFTFSCYLIKHGDAYMVWDTGFAPGSNPYAPNVGIADRLKELKVSPEQIKYVGVSHFHADHTGQLAPFTNATLFIGKGDWDQITSPTPMQGANVVGFKSSGDAAHFHENYENNGVPGANFDRAQTIASIQRVKQIVGNVKATVIIQHDMRDIGKLPAFPAAAK